MEKTMSLKNKKALVITGMNDELHSLFPVITGKKSEELLVLNSYGAVISKPYGCLLRSIIMALYKESIEEINIVGVNASEEYNTTPEEMLLNIKDVGVSDDTIKTLNYIDVVNHDLINWLLGPQDAKDVIKNNIDFIKGHPLIPNSIPIYGYIVNGETGDYELFE